MLQTYSVIAYLLRNTHKATTNRVLSQDLGLIDISTISTIISDSGSNGLGAGALNVNQYHRNRAQSIPSIYEDIRAGSVQVARFQHLSGYTRSPLERTSQTARTLATSPGHLSLSRQSKVSDYHSISRLLNS
jgi:hypothetical protein